MASSNIDYLDYKQIAPIDDEPPRQRGCLFYGCMIASVLAVLLLLAIGIVSFLIFRWVGTMVEEYTSIAPHLLQTVEMPDNRRAALVKRIEEFQKAVNERRSTPPLVLTSDDVNVLIERNPDWKGKAFITIDGDHIKGEVSIPLSEIPAFGLTRGRYLNGRAEFKIALEDGKPSVTIRSLEVNGRRPSEEFMKGIASRNLVEQTQFDPKTDRFLGRLESVEVKEGKLIVRARQPSKHPDDRSPAGGVNTLPDDVLAPADSRPAVPIEPDRTP